ncbi:hypothetical protein ACFLTZ_00930 [Chloroflexota bacterium]
MKQTEENTPHRFKDRLYHLRLIAALILICLMITEGDYVKEVFFLTNCMRTAGCCQNLWPIFSQFTRVCNSLRFEC